VCVCVVVCLRRILNRHTHTQIHTHIHTTTPTHTPTHPSPPLPLKHIYLYIYIYKSHQVRPVRVAYYTASRNHVDVNLTKKLETSEDGTVASGCAQVCFKNNICMCVFI
jgi:hypothetical protein